VRLESSAVKDEIQPCQLFTSGKSKSLYSKRISYAKQGS